MTLKQTDPALLAGLLIGLVLSACFIGGAIAGANDTTPPDLSEQDEPHILRKKGML